MYTRSPYGARPRVSSFCALVMFAKEFAEPTPFTKLLTSFDIEKASLSMFAANTAIAGSMYRALNSSIVKDNSWDENVKSTPF